MHAGPKKSKSAKGKLPKAAGSIKEEAPPALQLCSSAISFSCKEGELLNAKEEVEQEEEDEEEVDASSSDELQEMPVKEEQQCVSVEAEPDFITPADKEGMKPRMVLPERISPPTCAPAPLPPAASLLELTLVPACHAGTMIMMRWYHDDHDGIMMSAACMREQSANCTSWNALTHSECACMQAPGTQTSTTWWRRSTSRRRQLR